MIKLRGSVYQLHNLQSHEAVILVAVDVLCEPFKSSPFNEVSQRTILRILYRLGDLLLLLVGTAYY